MVSKFLGSSGGRSDLGCAAANALLLLHRCRLIIAGWLSLSLGRGHSCNAGIVMYSVERQLVEKVQ